MIELAAVLVAIGLMAGGAGVIAGYATLEYARGRRERRALAEIAAQDEADSRRYVLEENVYR